MIISVAAVALLLILGVVRAEKFEKIALISRKLCNNDPHDKLSQKCYNSQYSKEVECDTRVIASSNCTQISAVLPSLTEKVLIDLGSVVDNDWSIRKITLTLTSVEFNLILFGDLMDAFLLPRPMWSIVVEPYSSKDPRKYVLERYSQLWDPFFEHITRQQFPSSEVCSSSMILVGHQNCVHPGYSDVRKYYFEELGASPIIYGIYVPLEEKNMGRAFISDSDCPLEHDNRWTCAFLQTTNCTIPESAKTLDRPVSVVKPINEGGSLIKTQGHAFVDEASIHDTQIAVRKKRVQLLNQALPPFVYTSPFAHSSKMFKFHGPDEHQMPDFLFMEFIFRKTAYYRRKVAEKLAEFREKYQLGLEIRTKKRRFIAAHIRRSDRLGNGKNMTEFCHNLLVQRFTGVPQNCTYNDGRVMACQGNENVLGCDLYDDIPFGSVTLDQVVLDAESLIGPSIRNMILFSEDFEWLNKEISVAEKLHPEWKFFTMTPPHVSQRDVRMSGTDSGVFFLATIDLLQECDALLGHFNSGVPMTFAGAMCHHHAGMEGICPPVYNLKFRL